MKSIKISNVSVNYIPKLPIYSQKILYFLIQKIINEKKYINNENWSIDVIFSKKELFWLFDSTTDFQRRAFYINAKILFEPISITTEDSHIYTWIICWIEEKKRIDEMSIHINKYINNILMVSGHYFLLDFIQFCKLSRKSSVAIYQLLLKNKYKGKCIISPIELNSFMNIQYSTSDQKKLLFKAQKEFWEKGIDLDFNFELKKKWKDKYFEINIIQKDEFIEDNAKKMEDEVLLFYSNYMKQLHVKDIFYITQSINNMNDYQVDYLFHFLRNKRDETDKNIIAKIEWATPWNKNTYYYKVVCQIVLIIKYSEISKAIDLCSTEIIKGKIKDKIAFILARLKQLINK